ncbi:MAG TPA: serine/threonine-protein kinase [Vicinamibacterales bacterium]|nr:serine/threonine-protein kinase [Vicinamibacterales bacterium]
MTPERWQRVSELYEAVLDRPAGEREAFLTNLCAGDTGLRREVESLLAQDDHHSPLDHPVWVPEDLVAEDPDHAAGTSGAAGYNSGSSQRMRLAAGTHLGPYEILAGIGAGGMGEVYRGRDTRLDRLVAIKILRPDVAADPAFRARFDREARTISQLDHPNICPLFDVGDQGGVAYLVMPLLDGEALVERLRRGPLPLPAALRIAISLASALTYAHGRGVLHRDIKPHNMLMLADGRTMLLDFGIAKPYGLDSSNTMADTSPALTRIGQTLGTLEYMAPEQLAGRIVDGRSDMFSLGIVIAELVTGKHPFRGATPAVTASAILDRPYEGQPGATGPAAELDRIVRRMLALEPAERFPTMADCLAELRLLEHDSGARTTIVAAPRAPRVGRATVLAVIVVLAAAAALFVWRGRTAPSADSSQSSNAPAASPALPTTSPVVFWLDVRQGASPAAPIVPSLGDESYRNGWGFRVNVQPTGASHVYLVSDDRPGVDNPTGLEVLFAGTTPSGGGRLTTEWIGFAGAPGRDTLWLVSSATGISELAAAAARVSAGERGIVSDAEAGARLRAQLDASASQAQVSRDRSAARATLVGAGPSVVTRMELQHVD